MAMCSTRAVVSPASQLMLCSRPEGHGVRFDSDGDVIGVTIINATRLLKQDGYFTITIPRVVRLEASELAVVVS